MHSRFFINRKKSSFDDLRKRLFMSILFFTLVICAFCIATDLTSAKSIESQKDTLESAINRSIVECYAIEGSYPESLDYIKEHYGIHYNEDLFYVDYHPLGQDILPDVTIIEK